MEICGYRVQPAMAHKYLPFLNLLNRLNFFLLNQSAAKSMNTHSFTTGYARLLGQGGQAWLVFGYPRQSVMGRGLERDHDDDWR